MINQSLLIKSRAVQVPLLGYLLISICFPLYAGESDITVGAGVGYTDKPYRDYDDDEKTAILPILRYEGQHFFIRDTTVGWDFLKNDRLELAIIGKYLADGYDSGDSDFLSGMSDRDASIGVGGLARIQVGNLGLHLVAVTDVADESDGTQVTTRLDYRIKQGGFSLVPYMSVVWQDDDYNDYYYGVRSSEATSVRPAYSADDDFSYRFGVNLSYRKDGSPWLFTSGIQHEQFGDEIDDSPITNDDNVLSAFIGIGYVFNL